MVIVAPNPKTICNHRTSLKNSCIDHMMRHGLDPGTAPLFIQHHVLSFVGVAVDAILSADWTALMYAGNMAQFPVLQFLLENGANPNYHVGKSSLHRKRALSVSIMES